MRTSTAFRPTAEPPAHSTSIYSWNVNGLRAIHRKGFLEWLAAAQPEILALQETKCHPDQLPEAVRHPEGYHTYWSYAERRGYSGVALFSRRPPLSVHRGLGVPAYDREGRTLVAHYDQFVLIAVYVPSGARDGGRLDHKLGFLAALQAYCTALRNAGKRVIFCGDINIAHTELDLARPGQNRRTVGFLPQERAWIDSILADGFVDTLRHLHPERAGAYSWWTYRGDCRARNLGWRLDYLFADEALRPTITHAATHPDVLGSDHCPVSVTLSF